MALAYIAMIVVNVLAISLPINNQTTGEISSRIIVLFNPASFVFSLMWGIIYLVLAIWLYLAFKSRNSSKEVKNSIGYLFILSCILNISWLLTWHYEMFVLTVIIMISLLITLILIYIHYPKENKLSGRLPFSIYMGWISVALINNIAYVLKYFEWTGFGISEQAWTIILLGIGTILALLIRSQNNDIFYAFVFIIAFLGIAARWGSTEQMISFASVLFSVNILIGILILKPHNSTR